jgi:hypothetical protein
MKKVFVKISLCLALLFLSCQKKAEAMEETAAYSEETVEEVNSTEFSENSELDSNALLKTPKDKKFKKNVKLSLQVKNAYQTTLFVEDAVVDFGGYILKSKLEKVDVFEKIVSVSNDSIKKYVKSKTIDSIICKIPHQKVSLFLRNLEGKYTQLNRREISLEDVSQEYILGSNQNKSSKYFSAKLDKALNEGGKLEGKVEAIETLRNIEEEKNRNVYYQNNLHNDVKYATLEIELIEPEKFREDLMENLEKYEKAESPFWFSIKHSLGGGFDLLKKSVLILLSIWPFLLFISLIGYFFHKNKSKS